MFSVKDLIIYPVKSMAGISLSLSYMAESGFAFDRLFTLTTPDGHCITARDFPQLLQYKVTLMPQGIVIDSPNSQQSLEVTYSDFSHSPEPTIVWDDQFPAYIAAIKVNQWLSNLLQQDVQLRWLGSQSQRHLIHSHQPVSFADNYPYLLINQNSFKALKQRCQHNINIEQFRANIIIKNAPAFAEDGWKTIRIGQVIFDLVKPCNCCQLINIDPDSGSLSPTHYPLKTLKTFRSRDSGEIDFGWNMLPRNRGIIKINDKIDVLASQPAYHYRSHADYVETDTFKTVNIEFNDKQFVGNNQQILLEQLEQQGIHIPYSCRSGICIQCRVKLIDGKVTPLRDNSILGNDIVLSCSCRPASDLKLSTTK